MTKESLLLDSITDTDGSMKGRVVISGSHGGIYPASLASAANLRAILFNDAGIGFEKAGVAGVLALANVGMAAAAMDCESCLIGSAQDALNRGIISVVNSVAKACGVEPGMAVEKAAMALARAPQAEEHLPHVEETRHERILEKSGLSLVLVDSASLVTAEDKNRIVITGSHGCLIGGNPDRALKAAARVAVFNDAGIITSEAGISRLPALDDRGVSAVTVSHETARIGDAISAFETGVISNVNVHAREDGAEIGMPLKIWLQQLRPASIVDHS
ncbi:hypothetical protein [uncultured Sneathiella sp.]|uniref:hypothetical protein n=1 Tax=uncultured Sneathiella sp. TaxID=879315 RepID=UPI0030EF4116|tara:strand:- start:84686 stop:85507 length:822 start_codon:yes stop_codon:yes gene_type:complete